MYDIAASENDTTHLSQLLKAAGEPLRLTVLKALATDSYGVLELAKVFEVKQSGMSHHLKVLSNAGLVVTRREGNSIFYRRTAAIESGSNRQLIEALFAQVDLLSLDHSVHSNLEGVWKERSQASQNFFVQNAALFKQQQDLIADFEVYRQAITEMLESTTLESYSNALEVGPGNGDFLSSLSKRFTQVHAVDNSSLMLENSKKRAAEDKLNNIVFFQGDTSNLLNQVGQCDCAIINMVLHHTPSPAQIFHNVSLALNPGGALLVTELCPHDQEWTKESCGDLWLGLSSDDLKIWASEAGLTAVQSVFFALRNGFQIQIHQFFKSD